MAGGERLPGAQGQGGPCDMVTTGADVDPGTLVLVVSS